MKDKKKRRETGNRGRETRNRDVRQGTEGWSMEQRLKTGDRGLETRNRDVRQGTEDWRHGTET